MLDLLKVNQHLLNELIPINRLLHDHFGVRDELRKMNPIMHNEMFKYDMSVTRMSFSDVKILFSTSDDQEPARKKRKYE